RAPGLASLPPKAPSPAPLDPVRLDAALSRLREAEAAAQPSADLPSAAAHPARSDPPRRWLEPAFRLLTAADPATAGRLVLALLPVQRLVHPGPLRYDLVLAGTGCVQVTISEGGQSVQAELRDRPRAAEEVHFSVHGDLAALARLLAGGSTRWRFGRARAGIRGDRRAAKALPALIRVPLRLGELLDAGARMTPWLALSLGASMIDPGWTRGESFTVAFTPPGEPGSALLLRVGEGAPVAVVEAVRPPAGACEVQVPAAAVGEVLAGRSAPREGVRGEGRPLVLVQSWIERAQSG
ncbi:MAG: hypothetical protein M3Z27_01565, partial [Actinomycetota bacterium]|nr:hypothetical protein [Actinomycetota bacterium]